MSRPVKINPSVDVSSHTTMFFAIIAMIEGVILVYEGSTGYYTKDYPLFVATASFYTGILIFLVGGFIIYGAIGEHPYRHLWGCAGSFLAFLFVFFIGLNTLLVSAKREDEIINELEVKFKKFGDAHGLNEIDRIHSKFKCCGVEGRGENSVQITLQVVLSSCCADPHTNECETAVARTDACKDNIVIYYTQVAGIAGVNIIVASTCFLYAAIIFLSTAWQYKALVVEQYYSEDESTCA